MLWIVLTLLMVLAALAVARPIFWSRRRQSASGGTVYAAQLKEVDREEALGLVQPEDAQLARLEIKRRLANIATETTSPEDADMKRSDQLTLVGVVAAIVIGSAILYTNTGSPNAPASPHSAAKRSPGATAIMEAGLPSAAATANSNSGVASVDEMLTRLEDRLALNPDDVEGWRMLGWSRFRMGDVEGARQAYKKAVDLDGTDSDTLSAYGESIIRVAGGQISEEAAAMLTRAVTINPADPRARFLLGLKKEQDGDPEAALNDWIALLQSSSPGDEWRRDVAGRIEELADQLNMEVSHRLPEDMRDGAPGPTSAQVEASAAMTDAERAEMIESMVSRLDQKLQANPNDLDGWVRLIHARRILKQDTQAQTALKRAKAAFGNDAAALAALEDAATAPLEN
ncbi:MAG: c-type cytochrome biogenesis protein CcmI [Hyphomonas sp.]